MIIRLLFLVILGGAMHASGQAMQRPDVPDTIKAPAGEEVVLKLHAEGSQIYTCQQGTDGKPAWTLKGPEAELRDDSGKQAGRHFVGPTWKHADGSQVTGKAAARADSPDANSIPWLLLTVTEHSGEGALRRVTTIQRVNTKGGQPPAGGCDASKRSAEVKVPYTADYYFYAPAK